MTTKVVTRKKKIKPAEASDFRFTVENIPQNGPDFLRRYRQSAWELFQSLPMPTTQDEPWRRTDLRSLAVDELQTSARIPAKNLPAVPKNILQPLADDQHGGQIVLSPHGIQTDLHASLAAQGVVFTDLRTAAEQYSEILSKILGKVVAANEGRFAALTAALAEQGVLVYVPRGVQVKAPLHSVMWGPGSQVAHFSHLLVYLEEGASLTYIHEAASPPKADGQSLHAGLVEIFVGQNAVLQFVELQSWGDNIWNISHERAQVERDGRLDWVFGALGSHTTKNFSDLDLIGPGAQGRMSGFYFTDGVQHLDHDTQQNHLAPNTSSDLLFKGVLKGHSRSVWQGMIYVAPNAQKTDGFQANKNLLLSSDARADSIPGLEILADDVRCTHGATLGKIDQNQMYYLLSRGIPLAKAERLIVEGFFTPIMDRIPFDGVRERFQQSILEKMN